MAIFHDRRTNTQFSVTATDTHGSTYTTRGSDSKQAGRTMAHAIATGSVPKGSRVAGSHLVRMRTY